MHTNTKLAIAGTGAAALVLAFAGPPLLAGAADHLDAPGLMAPSGRADADITDVYAFQGSNARNTVLVLNTATATVPGQKVAAINCGGATCIAAGPGGLLAMTTNAGASWTKYAVPTSATTPSDFAAAICQSNVTCLAGGLGLLYSTANAGTSWSTSPVPATTTVSGFACPGPKNCVAIGSTSLVGTSS